MAGHSVAANLVMLVCLIGGGLSLRRIKQEVFPDLQIDIVTVTVPYPGASPEEVEDGILLAIEEAVQDLDGVDEVTSVAREGSGSVTIEVLLGYDAQRLNQDVKSEVDRITTFPVEAEEPIVSLVQHRRGVMDLILYGPVSTGGLHQLGEEVRDQLLQHPGISQIDVTGVPPLEIAIEVPQENLRRYGLTLEQVAQRLADAAVDLPSGGIDTRNGEILVRVKERRDYGRQFGELPIITSGDGTQVRLREIAVVEDGFEDTDRFSRYDGKPAVQLEVFRVGSQTPLTVAAAVDEALVEVKAPCRRGSRSRSSTIGPTTTVSGSDSWSRTEPSVWPWSWSSSACSSRSAWRSG
jgi:multidrug efflux pump subunit AcrB